MEVVKLVVKGSIDEYMIDLQNRKSLEIDKTIGEAALSDRQVSSPSLYSYTSSLTHVQGYGF